MDDCLLSELATWHGYCDPDGPVTGEDGRRQWYVPLDEWTDPGSGETFSLRGLPVAPRIVHSIQLCAPLRQSAQLFAGFRGTGKSTELSRVTGDLRELGEFSVLRVQAAEYHHMSDALSIEELALVLAAGIGEAARDDLGAPVLKEKSIWQRIWDFLHREVEAQQVRIRWGPLDLQGLLKRGDDFRDDLHRLLANKPDQLREFLHRLVEDVAAFVQPGQLVVLVDDLEKYYAPAERVGRVYGAMAELFFHHAELLRLPSCHVVYTVPPYLAFINPAIGDRYESSVHILPSVKVHGRPPDRRAHDQGLRALEEVLARRIDLDRLFGDQRKVCARELAAASGGHVRDLLRLTRQVLLEVRARLPAGIEVVRRAVNVHANSRGFLFREIHDLLQRVERDGSLKNLNSDELGELARAMDQYLVLCYQNARPWYDVHPLVRDLIAPLDVEDEGLRP
ncbi:MAG: hypothetical protein GY856_10140 [bacterium]|nr:hypothetical protein [bacterium]